MCLLYDCACVSRRTLVTQARWPGWSPTGGAITEVVTGSDWLGWRGEQWQRARTWVKPARGPSYGSGLYWLRPITGPAWTWAAQAFQFLRSMELVHFWLWKHDRTEVWRADKEWWRDSPRTVLWKQAHSSWGTEGPQGPRVWSRREKQLPPNEPGLLLDPCSEGYSFFFFLSFSETSHFEKGQL